MKGKTSIALAQCKNEIEFMQKQEECSNLLWIPTNIETLLYFKRNNLSYINPIDYLNNKYHEECLIESKKLISALKPRMNVDGIYHVRFLNIIRKYFFSTFYILKIITELNKKNKIDNIILSGWDSYDFNSTKNNYFVSRITYHLLKNKFNIKLLKKLELKLYKNKITFKIPKNLPDNFIIFSNLGYNFKKILFYKFFSNQKILIFDFNKVSKMKQIILKFLGVNFVNIKREKNFLLDTNIKINNFQDISYKYEDYDFSDLFNLRTKQICTEIDELKDIENAINRTLSENKPKAIYLNMTRGANDFLIKFSKKFNIPCYLMPHGTLSKGNSVYEQMYNDIISTEITSKDCINCVQTKIAEEFFKNKKEYKNVITGNLIFTSRKRSRGAKGILYAVTNRDFINNLPYGVESFFEFESNLRLLNDLAKKYKLEIIVKLHPMISHSINDLKNLFKYLVFSNNQLSKIIDKVLITVSFSSTVIEDSIVSRVPVILFDRWKRYKHCKAQENPNMKGSAIYYVNDYKNLLYAINTIRNSNKDINFNEYLYDSQINQDNFKKIDN